MTWMPLQNRMPSQRFTGVALLALCATLGALAGCGGSGSSQTEPAAFTLAVSPATLTAEQGASANYTVTLTSQHGFSAAVTPTVAGLPTGATATFQPASVTPTTAGAQTTLTVTAGAAGAATPTPVGTYTLTISGASGTIHRQVTTAFVVTAPPAPGSLTGNIQ